MKSPRSNHNHRHRGMGVPYEQCPRCVRDQQVCRQKIRFWTWMEADEWALEYNVTRGWVPPLMTRYRCLWCEYWHMKTARDKRARVWAEKMRRKWLVENRVTKSAEENATVEQWLRYGARVYEYDCGARPECADGCHWRARGGQCYWVDNTVSVRQADTMEWHVTQVTEEG